MAVIFQQLFEPTKLKSIMGFQPVSLLIAMTCMMKCVHAMTDCLDHSVCVCVMSIYIRRYYSNIILILLMRGHLNESVGITIVLCTLPDITLRLLCFKIVAIKQSYIVSYV